MPLLAFASLIGIVNQADGIRLIAVSLTLCRLASEVVLKTVSDDF